MYVSNKEKKELCKSVQDFFFFLIWERFIVSCCEIRDISLCLSVKSSVLSGRFQRDVMLFFPIPVSVCLTVHLFFKFRLKKEEECTVGEKVTAHTHKPEVAHIYV